MKITTNEKNLLVKVLSMPAHTMNAAAFSAQEKTTGHALVAKGLLRAQRTDLGLTVALSSEGKEAAQK